MYDHRRVLKMFAVGGERGAPHMAQGDRRPERNTTSGKLVAMVVTVFAIIARGNCRP